MNRWIKNVVDAATIVGLVIAAKTAIAEPYYVPSGSMEPTLQIGDALLATKYPYGYSAASLPISVTLPVSGDRVALRDGRLWINGTPVGIESDGTGLIEEENGAQVPAARFVETLPGNRRHAIFKRDALGMFDNMDEIVVPPDRLFVMGDNRDNSADSRVPVDAGGVGLLSVSAFVGRVDGLVGSWDLAVKNQPVWQWPSGFRLSRFFATVR